MKSLARGSLENLYDHVFIVVIFAYTIIQVFTLSMCGVVSTFPRVYLTHIYVSRTIKDRKKALSAFVFVLKTELKDLFKHSPHRNVSSQGLGLGQSERN